MLGTKISKSNWTAESRYCKFLKVIGLRKADTAKYHCLYVFLYIYQAKNLQYMLPSNTTYKKLYPTTKTIPFGAKNNVYQMAT